MIELRRLVYVPDGTVGDGVDADFKTSRHAKSTRLLIRSGMAVAFYSLEKSTMTFADIVTTYSHGKLSNVSLFTPPTQLLFISISKICPIYLAVVRVLYRGTPTNPLIDLNFAATMK